MSPAPAHRDATPVRQGRPRRVLLAWEQGAGFGHSVRLATIGAELMRENVEVVAAVRQFDLATPLTARRIPLLQAPPWPLPPPRPGDEVPASATLTESLAAFGLRDAEGVRTVLAGWKALLDATSPDLVICDYAPLAALAARGRARVMQTGSAFYLPPAHLEAMPLFHGFAPVRHGDGELLATLNTALDAEGLAPMTRIGDLFGGDDCFVASFALLDPHIDLRLEPPLGPLASQPPVPPRPDAAGLFAYLHPDVVAREDVCDTLCRLGPLVEAYLPLAPSQVSARLAAAGVRLHAQPVAMGETLARVRMILHQGNAGVASDALIAGRPQFAMGLHVEHYLNGQALAAAGVARHALLFDPAYRLDPAQVLGALEDEDMALVADAAGDMHRAVLAERPLDQLMARCRALL